MARARGAERESPERMISRGERFAVAAVLVFVALFSAGALYGGGEDLLRRLANVGPLVIAGLLGLSLCNYAARAIRWQVFSRELNVSPGWRLASLYYVAGYSMTATPGKVGEALRLWLLRRGHGFRYVRTVALLVADRLGDLVAMVILCLLAIASFERYLPAAAMAGLLTLTLVVLFLRPRAAIACVSRVYGLVRRWPRAFARLRRVSRHAGRLASARVCGAALLLGLAGWFAEIVAFQWLLMELGVGLDFARATFIFSFSMLVGALVMLPGGLIGAEASMVGLLTASGVELPVALAATAIIRVTTLWFAVLLGFLALPASLRAAERGRRGAIVEQMP